MIKPEQIYAFIGFLATLITLWNVFSAKLTAQEKRLTTIDMQMHSHKEKLLEHTRRLENHEQEYRVMVALVEKVDNLAGDIKEIKEDLKKGKGDK